MTTINDALTLLRECSVRVRDRNHQNELIDQVIDIVIAKLETIDATAVAPTVLNDNIPVAVVAPPIDQFAIQLRELGEQFDSLAHRVDTMQREIDEVERQQQVDGDLGDRLESLEKDLSDLRDDLPIDWEEATVEKIDEVVPNMVKGQMRDYLDRVRLSIVPLQEG